jgi:hypothetical protein
MEGGRFRDLMTAMDRRCANRSFFLFGEVAEFTRPTKIQRSRPSAALLCPSGAVVAEASIQSSIEAAIGAVKI